MGGVFSFNQFHQCIGAISAVLLIAQLIGVKCSLEIKRHPLSFLEHSSQVKIPLKVSLLQRLLKKLSCLCKILWHLNPFVISDSLEQLVQFLRLSWLIHHLNLPFYNLLFERLHLRSRLAQVHCHYIRDVFGLNVQLLNLEFLDIDFSLRAELYS